MEAWVRSYIRSCLDAQTLLSSIPSSLSPSLNNKVSFAGAISHQNHKRVRSPVTRQAEGHNGQGHPDVIASSLIDRGGGGTTSFGICHLSLFPFVRQILKHQQPRGPRKT
ncbi:hypothetical protein FSOLCH5_009684 [Fusarium solani]|nr:hypothetical protein NW759_002588 [Fusarium solani]